MEEQEEPLLEQDINDQNLNNEYQHVKSEQDSKNDDDSWIKNKIKK